MAPPRKRYCKYGHDMLIYAKTEKQKTKIGTPTYRRYCSECHRIAVNKSNQKKREKNESRSTTLADKTSDQDIKSVNSN